MAARVSIKSDWKQITKTSYSHAMGPNVAGVIGSAIAAGVMLNMSVR
ncbi:MAG: sodium ion-translocating decarboxylase subunit beta [Haemophilus parainfluenzae]